MLGRSRAGFLGLLLSAMVNPANYGQGDVRVLKSYHQRIQRAQPKIEQGKTLSSPNRLSQKGLRKRAKWG